MTTVAKRLREEDEDRLRRMTVAERVAEALALGRAAVAAYAAAHGLDPREARRRLEQNAQIGRAPSRVMRGIVE